MAVGKQGGCVMQAEQMDTLIEEDEVMEKTGGLSFTSSRDDVYSTPVGMGASAHMSSSSNLLSAAHSGGQLAPATSGPVAVADPTVVAGMMSSSASAAGSGASPQDTTRSDQLLPAGTASGATHARHFGAYSARLLALRLAGTCHYAQQAQVNTIFSTTECLLSPLPKSLQLV
jgi:hypothetical protein